MMAKKVVLIAKALTLQLQTFSCYCQVIFFRARFLIIIHNRRDSVTIALTIYKRTRDKNTCYLF